MGVRLENGIVHLEGECGVEDAEPLVAALTAASAARVDLSQCRQLHSAVVQALLAFRAGIDGTPEDHFLATFIVPALQGRPKG